MTDDEYSVWDDVAVRLAQEFEADPHPDDEEQMNDRLEDTIAHGNCGHNGYGNPSKIECDDGFTISVVAGGGTYCYPRPALCTCALSTNDPIISHPWPGPKNVPHDFPGPFTHVEVGFPSKRPEPWDEWEFYADDPDDPTETIYSFVPVELVRALIAKHSAPVLQ